MEHHLGGLKSRVFGFPHTNIDALVTGLEKYHRLYHSPSITSAPQSPLGRVHRYPAPASILGNIFDKVQNWQLIFHIWEEYGKSKT